MNSHIEMMNVRKRQVFKEKMGRRLERLSRLTPETLRVFKDSYTPAKTRDESILTGARERRAKVEAARMLKEQFADLRKQGWPV